MTSEHLALLLTAAEAKKDDKGWSRVKEGHHITLHVANNGASLAVSRVEAVKVEGVLLKTRTTKGELYVLAMEDVFAGAVEEAASSSRKAGFV